MVQAGSPGQEHADVEACVGEKCRYERGKMQTGYEDNVADLMARQQMEWYRGKTEEAMDNEEAMGRPVPDLRERSTMT